MKKGIRKILSGSLSVAFMATSLPNLQVHASNSASQTFNFNGYSITYEVENSWGNTEAVNVTLTNTGESTIEDWMLYFNPNGKITSNYKSQISITSAGTFFFKNDGYNANIAPEDSITFSYHIDDCAAIPTDFILCQKRAAKDNGYSVELNVNDTWGNNFNGSIVLNNNTDKPIEAWELTFDTNFTITEITNSWAATVSNIEPYKYMLKGTYTSVIPANSSVVLGFTGVKNSTPTISNTFLTEIVPDDSLIDNISECFDLAETLDSDQDGLPDCFELKIGTNPYLSDTDNDGLSDYEEVYTYGTNYLNPDTDGDGLKDGDEGYNGTFYQKYEVYFNPFDPDTDDDGIVDGKEIIEQEYISDISDANDLINNITINCETSDNIEDQIIVRSAAITDELASYAVGNVSDPISILPKSENLINGCADVELNLDAASVDSLESDDFVVLYHDLEDDQLYELETYYDSSDFTIRFTAPNIYSNFVLADADQWHQVYKSSIVYDTSAYRVINDTGLTWAQSKAYCENMGGHLVTISSEAEQKYIMGLLSQYGHNYTYWLGYRFVRNYDDTEPYWESINGEGVPYTNWAPGEPNEYENESVAHMYNIVPSIALSLGAERGQWNDTLDEQDFNLEYSYLNSGIICEFDSTVDSDDDGIPDIIETAGMVTKNGRILYTDPDNPDTDGDGVSDGSEMIMECKTEKRIAYLNPGQEFLFDDPTNYEVMANGKIKGEVSFVYYEYNSDPTVPDNSKLSIKNYVTIPDIDEKTPVSIYGEIESNFDITEVTVGIYTEEIGGTAYSPNTAYPNSKYYNISKLDDFILFNELPGGQTYYFRVTATDSSGRTATLINQQFSVGATSELRIENATKIPNIAEGTPVSISGNIVSNFNITSVVAGVYNSENGGVAYTEKSAVPNSHQFDIKTLDYAIEFNKVPAGGERYFRVIASDASGNTKTLINQPFNVTSTISNPNVTDDVNKILTKIRNCSTISQYGAEKVDSCVAAAQIMLENGYELSFVSGMLGNICHEGNVGLFEGNTGTDYIYYMDVNYNYLSKYGLEYIYNVNLNEVYAMINDIKQKSTIGEDGVWRVGGSRVGFGLGSIQWTFSRTYNLITIYREVCNNSSSITKAQATTAEMLMITRELNSDYFNYIHTDWKASNPAESSTSAYNAAYDLCWKYEIPGDSDYQAANRYNDAQSIYSYLIS